MKKILLLSLLCFAAGSWALAQQPSAPSSRRLTVKKSAVVELNAIPHRYMANLERIPTNGQGQKAYNDWLNVQMENLEPGTAAVSHKTTLLSDTMPIVGATFNGNTYYSGIPNDNDMAISNGGHIISVINSNIFIFDTTGTSLMDITLGDFSDTLGLTADKFDPKVIYDPAEDRFVIVFLSGFTSATSDIVVAFSQTSDPTGLWNLYALDGDPLAYGNAFTDYPIIALTEHEFFVTINMVLENVSWQTGFVESLIWQCDKFDGYNGDSLDTRLWNNISYGPGKVRNLCPVRGGSALTGPDLYLLSNRNFSASNDTIFFVHLTDTMNGPAATVTVTALTADEPYGFAGNARQPSGKYFTTNDSRILGAFLENNTIQFVGNSKDQVLQTPGVYHGVIRDVTGTPTVSGHVISDSTLHFGYPNLALISDDGGNQSIITFNHTGIDTFAGCSAVFFDGFSGYSVRTRVKAGLNYVDIPWYPGVERWGDYSGCQRRYNQPGKAWMGASYGKLNKEHGTWIAEIGLGDYVASRPAPRPAQVEVAAYPNPAFDLLTIEFEQQEFLLTEIQLFDETGKLMKTFIRDHLRPGLQRFSLNTMALPAGVYFLRVTTAGLPVAAHRIAVQH